MFTIIAIIAAVFTIGAFREACRLDKKKFEEIQKTRKEYGL